jgi:hypothetical protein
MLVPNGAWLPAYQALCAGALRLGKAGWRSKLMLPAGICSIHQILLMA